MAKHGEEGEGALKHGSSCLHMGLVGRHNLVVGAEIISTCTIIRKFFVVKIVMQSDEILHTKIVYL